MPQGILCSAMVFHGSSFSTFHIFSAKKRTEKFIIYSFSSIVWHRKIFAVVNVFLSCVTTQEMVIRLLLSTNMLSTKIEKNVFTLQNENSRKCQYTIAKRHSPQESIFHFEPYITIENRSLPSSPDRLGFKSQICHLFHMFGFSLETQPPWLWLGTQKKKIV